LIISIIPYPKIICSKTYHHYCTYTDTVITFLTAVSEDTDNSCSKSSWQNSLIFWAITCHILWSYKGI